ncbi:hypothetical protein MUK42_18814 [Musa troglodytarum]|uniref:DUF7811 domain-containing protein n=1 Tax=Musa troglodytarum TaxID=320322 RepID=A0A9E7ES66_9LILI|nr:hypothetical protein MUK42_07946 [Musa troglodytarum]URD81726.1 hypothetical protein MUK42_18814 [Musa troglodytarum]
MADSSSLWFSPSFHALRGARSGSPDANPLRRKLAFLRSRPSPSSSSPAPSLPKLKSLVLRGRRSPRPRAKESDDEGGCFGDDPYGPYPWESSVFSDGPTIEWVPEDRITLFTSEGLIQIGGSLVPRRFPQVVTAEKVSNEGLLEKLTMTVVVPLLWGVPPASDTLRFAVRSGGGIVEKVYWQWNFL